MCASACRHLAGVVAAETIEYGALEFNYNHPFDGHGVLSHLGSACGKSEYLNPHKIGAVVASMSSVQSGSADRFVEQRSTKWDNSTADKAGSWMQVDLGADCRFKVNHYSLRHGFCYGSLRCWELQATNDPGTAGNELEGHSFWDTLRTHQNDVSLTEEPFCVAAWPVSHGAISRYKSYRYFRIIQTQCNSDGTDSLSCSGIELYGTLVRDLPAHKPTAKRKAKPKTAAASEDGPQQGSPAEMAAAEGEADSRAAALELALELALEPAESLAQYQYRLQRSVLGPSQPRNRHIPLHGSPVQANPSAPPPSG